MVSHSHKTESQNFVDPRFSKTLVLVKSRVWTINIHIGLNKGVSRILSSGAESNFRGNRNILIRGRITPIGLRKQMSHPPLKRILPLGHNRQEGGRISQYNYRLVSASAPYAPTRAFLIKGMFRGGICPTLDLIHQGYMPLMLLMPLLG